MTEPKENDLVRDRLAAIHAEAERAWQDLTCPRPARFWNIALKRGEWTAEERRHVQSCPQCQAAEAKVYMAVQGRALPVAAVMVLVAARLLRRLPVASQFADLASAPPEQRLAFADDPDLGGVLFRDQGAHWLHLEHQRLPAGTLLLLTVADAAAPGWSRYLVLRSGFEHAVARCQLDAALPDDGRERQLAVRIIPSPAALVANDGPLLRQSYADASRDDPAARAAWESWARAARQETGVPGEIVQVLDEIAAGGR